MADVVSYNIWDSRDHHKLISPQQQHQPSVKPQWNHLQVQLCPNCGFNPCRDNQPVMEASQFATNRLTKLQNHIFPLFFICLLLRQRGLARRVHDPSKPIWAGWRFGSRNDSCHDRPGFLWQRLHLLSHQGAFSAVYMRRRVLFGWS